jgi:hypothetical protein
MTFTDDMRARLECEAAFFATRNSKFITDEIARSFAADLRALLSSHAQLAAELERERRVSAGLRDCARKALRREGSLSNDQWLERYEDALFVILRAPASASTDGEA